MEEIVSQKSVYQIYLTKKDGKILLDRKVIGFNESEAIKKAKVGGVIKELGLTRDKVDFFIKIIGHLYEGTFDVPLSEIAILTAEEKVFDEIADLKLKVAELEKKVIK